MTVKRAREGIASAILVLLLLAGLPCWAQEHAGEETGQKTEDPEDGERSEEANRVELADPLQPDYIVESIEVRGNDKTKGSLIISYLLLKPGESVDEEKVQLSRVRLLALGYFKNVHMGMEKGSRRGRVKLVVEVEERNTIIIDDLFIGFSDTNPWWFGAGVSDINFLGRGLVLSGAVVGSEHQQAGRLGISWPSVLNTRLQLGFETFVANGRELALAGRMRPNDDQPGCNDFINEDQSLEYFRSGGVVNTGLRVDKVHRISVDLRIEHIEADFDTHVGESGRSCENDPFLGYLRDGQSTLSSLTFRFERDTRDDYFLSTHGMYLLISVELASKVFGSDYEFSKYIIKYEHSFPAFLDHAFRFSLMGGLIQDVGEVGSPFFSRFFEGDYAFFKIDKDSLPRNLELNFSEVVDYGDLMASITVEYDIPLWATGKFFYRGFIYAALNFTYVTKAEFLKSVDEEWSGRTKKPLSIDLGFKVDTPVGLFTLSLGYVFDLILE